MAWRFTGSFALSACLLSAACVAAMPSFAQSGPEAKPAPDWVTPPSDLPRQDHGPRAPSLDTLFDALKIAPDAESAKAIETRIWGVWMISGSDTCNLLMGRAKAAADEIKPGYVEGWNRRATVYYLMNDYGHSLADIREVLSREPRHFGALAGLGLILQELGDDAHALEAYRRALAINPHLEHVGETVKTLREKVEGRDI
jgi:tetratricopeptide (TPR) repeat protein